MEITIRIEISPHHCITTKQNKRRGGGGSSEEESAGESSDEDDDDDGEAHLSDTKKQELYRLREARKDFLVSKIPPFGSGSRAQLVSIEKRGFRVES